MSAHAKGLSFVENWLSVWVVLAIVAGLCLDKFVPGMGDTLKQAMPLGLFLMVYPAMVKIKLGELPSAAKNWKPLALVIAFNYLLNPLLMFGLGWLFLRESPAMWIGVTLLGVAPCIGMVLVWTDLARGNNLLSIVLRTWDTLTQIFVVPLYLYWLVSPILGRSFSGSALNSNMVMEIVVYFLAVPLALGVVSRKALAHYKGEEWIQSKFLPPLGKFQLAALLFTIVVIFSQKGHILVSSPGLLTSVAMPIILFHFLVFGISFYCSKTLGFKYEDAVAAGFNATGRNFELAIVMAVTVFADMPGVALATVVGPLVEIPMMLGIVWFMKKASAREYEMAGMVASRPLA